MSTISFNQASHLMADALKSGIPIDDWEDCYGGSFEPIHRQKIQKVKQSESNRKYNYEYNKNEDEDLV